MAEEPVLVLNGARTVGKSTLLAHIANSANRTVLDLDDPATRAAVRNDPGRFVSGRGPILIDEYQHVPELLDAIKAELNRDLSPGRFVLAGSTRYSTLPQAGQALTGRVDIIDVNPLSQGEIGGTRESFIEDLLNGGQPPDRTVASTTTRDDYARRITSGGMPVALRRPAGASRSRWFANYQQLVLERDVLEISRIRQREMLPQLFAQLTMRTGQVLNLTSAAQAIGLEKSTAENYLRLLEAVFLLYRLPAWGTTLGSRVARHPKLHLVDSGLAAWKLGLTPAKIDSGMPAALSEYGHLAETFAVSEILKQLSWWDGQASFGHFRTSEGEEVDLVVETDDGRIIAFEFKVGSRVHGEDLRGIRTLRERLGDRLATAVVFYTGEHMYRHEEGAFVVPLDGLWS
ncbi:ATP-binding protein [Nocardia sp. NPDC058658]|uniref:ATP-binding protein n=1 Tax=Nocardia sp. NPDC058658 TaxID=3346580 RepID=UPI003658B932